MQGEARQFPIALVSESGFFQSGQPVMKDLQIRAIFKTKDIY